ncbi:MAG: hypothetical protein M3300_13115 [Actinomycetota bacterium]|nr:hypothetical protein [Actinomycetota bacterium]
MTGYPTFATYLQTPRCRSAPVRLEPPERLRMLHATKNDDDPIARTTTPNIAARVAFQLPGRPTSACSRPSGSGYVALTVWGIRHNPHGSHTASGGERAPARLRSGQLEARAMP